MARKLGAQRAEEFTITVTRSVFTEFLGPKYNVVVISPAKQSTKLIL